MSYEQEHSIISALLNNNSAIERCEGLTPDCFTDDTLRLIFSEILRQSSGNFDVITIGEKLSGSVGYVELNEIAQNGYGNLHIAKHCAALIAAKKNRQLYAVSSFVVEMAESDKPLDERIDLIGAELSKLVANEASSDDWIDSEQSAIEHIAVLEQRDEGKIAGISTGLCDFDDLLDGGFQRGNLIVIGARPSMGKTALGLTMGVHIAQSHSVGFLSMEMPHVDVRDRMIALLGNVSLSALKRPKNGLEWDRVVDAVERAKHLKFNCSDKGGLNILQIRSKARQLKRKKGLDVLVVDYIGLMSGLDGKMSRAYQIEEISRGLKTLAKELDIVVICLAQVNRGAVERSNQLPGLQDLRDSGAIEQDADVVGFIHRPIMADPTLADDWKNFAQFRVAKNRQGRCGDISLFYHAEQTKFGSWSGFAPKKASKGGSL